MDRSQPKALPRQQASGPPVAHRLAATPALGEGDADAAGNGLQAPTHYSDEPYFLDTDLGPRLRGDDNINTVFLNMFFRR